MKFRLGAFGLHLLGSFLALSLVLGAFQVGWYHWPGWQLTDAMHVLVMVVGVDVVIGPLITLVIASERKPRRELARDIAIVVAVQLAALGYGTTTLWNGRPLYYAFSVNCLQVIQAYDIDPEAARQARARNLSLAPHWYSRPRWIWAAFPDDPKAADKVFQGLMQGGYDITGFPQYYKPWQDAASQIRSHLSTIGSNKFFAPKERTLLAKRMQAAGLAADQANGISLTGRGTSLLAVFDPRNLRLLAILQPT